MYAHPVRKSILKKYGLPHTVAEWYVCREHESLLKEYGLPHTVVEWYVQREHKSLLKEYRLPHTVAESQTQKFTERIRLLLNGTYLVNTKFYKVLYTWQCVL